MQRRRKAGALDFVQCLMSFDLYFRKQFDALVNKKSGKNQFLFRTFYKKEEPFFFYLRRVFVLKKENNIRTEGLLRLIH